MKVEYCWGRILFS